MKELGQQVLGASAATRREGDELRGGRITG